jgi:hypothetical protein
MYVKKSIVLGPQLFTHGGRDALVDRLLDAYVSWHEECSDVAASYTRWNQATPDEHVLAFGAYVAALDREERAAAVYRHLIDRLATAPIAADPRGT